MAVRDVPAPFMYTRSGHPVLAKRPVTFSRTTDFGLCPATIHRVLTFERHTTRLYLGKRLSKYFVYRIFFFIVQYLKTVWMQFFNAHITVFESIVYGLWKLKRESILRVQVDFLYSFQRSKKRFTIRTSFGLGQVHSFCTYSVQIFFFLYRTKLVGRCGNKNNKNYVRAITPKVKYKFVNKERREKQS